MFHQVCHQLYPLSLKCSLSKPSRNNFGNSKHSRKKPSKKYKLWIITHKIVIQPLKKIMPHTLPVFDKFFNKEDALNYYNIFTDNDLHPDLEDPSEFFDAIIGHARSNEYYLLRLA